MPKPKPYTTAEPLTADDRLISEAQKSWVILQESQGSQLAHWLTLGRGLVAGRKKHPSNTAFSKWCMQAGFAFVSPDDRGDARWLAEQWDAIRDEIQPGHTHPHVIRAHFRRAMAAPADKRAPTLATTIMAMRPLNEPLLLSMPTPGSASGDDEVVRIGLKALAKLREMQAELGEDDYGPLRVHAEWFPMRCLFETLKPTHEDYGAILGMLNAWSPEGVKRTARLRRASVLLSGLVSDLALVEQESAATMADIASKDLYESDSHEAWENERNLLIDILNRSTSQQNEIMELITNARAEERSAEADIAASCAAPLPPMTVEIREDTDELDVLSVPASMASKTLGELKAIVALHPNASDRAEARVALEALGAA